MARRRSVEAIDLESRALELWVGNCSYREIASEMQCSVSTAYRRVGEALSSLRPHADADRYRTVQIAELEVARSTLRKFMTAESLSSSDRMSAIRELIQLQQHETKILGLDRVPLPVEEFALMSDEELEAFIVETERLLESDDE